MNVRSVETEKVRVLPGEARGRHGKERRNVMRRHVVVVVALIGIAGMGVAAQALQFGIVARIPLALSVQLGLAPGFAVEVGLSGAGPLVASAKVYPWQLELGALTLRPLVGLGVGLAFLPGDIVAHAFFALVGVEVPVGDTAFTAIGELGVTISPDVSPSGIGPAVGARIDFDLGG